MVSNTLTLSALGLLALTQAVCSKPIEWGACPSSLPSPVPIECGTYAVPLDYTDKSSKAKLNLQMVRVPAAKQPAVGSIFLNFGGPGGATRPVMGRYGGLLSALSGGKYDLIGIDPRGTGDTLPFTCYSSDIQLQRFYDNTLYLPRSDDAESIGRLWARATIDTKNCAKAHNDTGDLIGTAFVARDIAAVAKALGEGDKIRYWGFSYGSTLGATLVSMFPHRIARAVLDGVQNPHEYYHAAADYSSWTQSDEVFSGIFEYCVKNADKCSLASRGNAKELERQTLDLYERLKNHPVGVGETILDHNFLNIKMAEALYYSSSWPQFTQAIDTLLGPEDEYDYDFLSTWLRDKLYNGSAFLKSSMALVSALMGIHCSDRDKRLPSLDAFDSVQYRLNNISLIMGPGSTPTMMACAQWGFDAKERYEGDFQVSPRNPVLLLGNRYDGHTPIASARNVSSGFEGSVVLELNGYGHSSLGLPSKCVFKQLNAYWANGTMPDEGTVCEVDGKPWSNITWADVIEMSGGDSTGVMQKRELGEEVDLLHGIYPVANFPGRY